MNDTAERWTLDGFVEYFNFVHEAMLDHKFAWVLGAGASEASNILLGSHLVDRWLKEMHVKEDINRMPLEEWATADRLGIAGFKFDERASFYSRVYHRRFQAYPDEGYADLERTMSAKDPSPGYAVLAVALAAKPPRHNVVITTNFDNLVADALSIYTDTFPFVAGHESLTEFVRVAMRRPLICKIHRDLLMAPQSDSRSLRRLHDAWGTALRALFQHYTPVIIGYGGNDDTLMDLFESLEPADIKGRLIWCHYKKTQLSERITNVVADLKGVLVPVPEFDRLMIILGDKMGITELDGEIGKRAEERTQRFRKRVQLLDFVDDPHPAVTRWVANTLGNWWEWHQRAEKESSPSQREKIYREGIRHYPQSAQLHGNFANFMKNIQGDQDQAEKLFRKALNLDPKDANITGNFATFMTDVRKNHDEAERLYRKALELDPKDANICGNFAFFISDVRKDYDEAERLYRKALELDPKDANHTSNFALFMSDVRRNYEEAEPLYLKAIELEPESANNVSNYAAFLFAQGRVDEATRRLEQAETLNCGESTESAVELALYGAIFARVKQEDDTRFIQELRRLFREGFARADWNFDEVLAFTKNKVSKPDYDLFSALATGIMDPKQIPNIDLLLEQRAAARRNSRINEGKPISQDYGPNGHERNGAAAG